MAHLTANLSLNAFAKSYALGINGFVSHKISSDVNVIWSVLFNGRMAGNQSVWQQKKPTCYSIRSWRHQIEEQHGR